jgi:hypothetical protein
MAFFFFFFGSLVGLTPECFIFQRGNNEGCRKNAEEKNPKGKYFCL